MSFAGVIAIILLSLMLTFIFVFGLKSKGPWGSAWSFFLIVILSLSTVSLWVPPAGPIWLGAAWIDLLITGLLVSFFMSAVTPLKYPKHSGAKNEIFSDSDLYHESEHSKIDDESGNRDILKLGGVFWMLLVVLCALTIMGVV